MIKLNTRVIAFVDYLRLFPYSQFSHFGLTEIEYSTRWQLLLWNIIDFFLFFRSVHFNSIKKLIEKIIKKCLSISPVSIIEAWSTVAFNEYRPKIDQIFFEFIAVSFGDFTVTHFLSVKLKIKKGKLMWTKHFRNLFGISTEHNQENEQKRDEIKEWTRFLLQKMKKIEIIILRDSKIKTISSATSFIPRNRPFSWYSSKCDWFISARPPSSMVALISLLIRSLCAFAFSLNSLSLKCKGIVSESILNRQGNSFYCAR